MSLKAQKIPDLVELENIIKDMKSLFEYSIEYCNNILIDIPKVNHVNNREKSNYLNCDDEIEYLLQDFRSDIYSPFQVEYQHLKEFKNNLDSYDSDLYEDQN